MGQSHRKEERRENSHCIYFFTYLFNTKRFFVTKKQIKITTHEKKNCRQSYNMINPFSIGLKNKFFFLCKIIKRKKNHPKNPKKDFLIDNRKNTSKKKGSFIPKFKCNFKHVFFIFSDIC